MRTWNGVSAGVAAGLVLWTAAAFAQATPPAGPPERVDGQVVKIDHQSKKVTVQSGGTTYEFQASDETLKDLKVGDRIEAKLRPKG
jgi:Cu/Ag efflux protein CusF